MALGAILKRKKTTAADLPEEVVTDQILTRLPIKSVVRFKCVSKAWLSLFSHPRFVRDHLTHSSTQNPNEYDCLIAKKNKKIVILSRYKETFVLPSTRSTLIGSINGLVCLSNDKKLSLWNPAIRQSKEFTAPLHSSCSRNNTALGFDHVSNDYKIVVLSADKSSASVYSSNKDSWNDIIVPDHVFPKNEASHSSSPTTIVKDCPYWTFCKYMHAQFPNDRHFIPLIALCLITVKFDARRNEFKLMPAFHGAGGPDQPINAFAYEFVDVNDRLTLMVHEREFRNVMVDIFYLDEEGECCVWCKMYSLGPLDFYTTNWWVSLSQGFKYGGEILFSEDGMFCCYDHRSHTIRRIPGTTSTLVSPPICFRYIPSLVCVEGMKSVYLTTQTRRTTDPCYRIPRRLINSLGG